MNDVQQPGIIVMLAPTYGTTATVAQDGSLLGWLVGWLVVVVSLLVVKN